MFFDGDLQSGIALALQESKCVTCFVRGLSLDIWLQKGDMADLVPLLDTGAQSKLWEDEFFHDDEVGSLWLSIGVQC